MKKNSLKVIVITFLTTLMACVQQNKTSVAEDAEDAENTNEQVQTVNTQPHRYGGWYCPDNLKGFPAVDIANWKNVPVVNNRMPTKEETQSSASLIFVDSVKYPDAKPLDIKMPKLARFYNESAQREDFVIVIQAINVANDSIVGFRYLNGGNGSARLNEVTFLADSDVEMLSSARFVTSKIEIRANQDKVWEIITQPENAEALRPSFDEENTLQSDWRTTTNFNYYYQNNRVQTATYANKLYGCFYVQNDYQELEYTEKFLLIENRETGITELNIVCGPFLDDFVTQRNLLNQWGLKVKELSEQE